MSVISEQVRLALFAKLNVSQVTTLATGGVHFQVAAQGSALPYLVFDRVPGLVDYALGNKLVGERDLWLIKAYADEDSSETLEPPQVTEAILAAAETAVGQSLTLTTNTVVYCRRKMDIPSGLNDQSDRHVYQHGFWLDIFTV
jgi:hypothetical protein